MGLCAPSECFQAPAAAAPSLSVAPKRYRPRARHGSSREVCSPSASPRTWQWHFDRVCLARPPAPSGFLNLVAPRSAPCLPALFHAGSALGVAPFRAFLLPRGRTPSPAPFPSCRWKHPSRLLMVMYAELQIPTPKRWNPSFNAERRSAVPRYRSSVTRRSTPVGSPEIQSPPPKRQLPSSDTRALHPVSRYRGTEARSPTPDEPPDPRSAAEATFPFAECPLQRPPWNLAAEAPRSMPDANRHRTPNPPCRSTENPPKSQHRSAGTPLHPRRRNAANPPGARHRGAVRSPSPQHPRVMRPRRPAELPRTAAEAPVRFPRPLPRFQPRSRNRRRSASSVSETLAKVPAPIARFEHRALHAEASRTRRDPDAETPEPLRTRVAEAPRILRARDTEVPCAHQARAAEASRARRPKTGYHRVEQARGSSPAFRGLLRARVRHSPPAV
jgi:hypothetical protein